MTDSHPDYKVSHIWNSIVSRDRAVAGTQGVITLVSREASPGTFIYGFSFCQPGDNFAKKAGIAQAVERMESQDKQFAGMIRYNAKKSHFRIRGAIIMDYLNVCEWQLPQWARVTLSRDLVRCIYIGYGQSVF